jgi:hypothetical protein
MGTLWLRTVHPAYGGIMYQGTVVGKIDEVLVLGGLGGARTSLGGNMSLHELAIMGTHSLTSDGAVSFK